MGHADNVSKHLKAMMHTTMAEMKSIQPNPHGQRERSTREMNRMWDRVMALPDQEKQRVIMDMAERAGHKDGESPSCELCRFLHSKLPKGDK